MLDYIFVPFYAYNTRIVVTRHVSYPTQFTHIYKINAWLPLIHSVLSFIQFYYPSHSHIQGSPPPQEAPFSNYRVNSKNVLYLFSKVFFCLSKRDTWLPLFHSMLTLPRQW